MTPDKNRKNTYEAYTVQENSRNKNSSDKNKHQLHGKPNENTGRLDFDSSKRSDSHHKDDKNTSK